MPAFFPEGTIFEVARAAGREFTRLSSSGEMAIQCPRAENHRHNDAHPSCRLNSEKNTWFCDPCGRGGGVAELAGLLGVDLSTITGTKIPDASMPKARPRASAKRVLHFVSNGPVSANTQLWFRNSLSKAYTAEAWRALGVEEGTIDDQLAIAFPLPSGGYKVCLYRRPDPKRRKPYTFWFADGGKTDLLLVGDGNEVLLVAGEWDMLAALSAGINCVATGTGGEGAWKVEWSKQLAGKRVLITYDVDPTGHAGTQMVVEALQGFAREVYAVRLPLSGDIETDGKDLSDFLAVAGPEGLRALLEETRQKGPIPAAAKSADQEPKGPASIPSRLAEIEQILKFVPADANEAFKLSVFARLLPILAALDPVAQDLAAKQVKTKLGISMAAIRKEIEAAGSRSSQESRSTPEETEISEESRALLRDPNLVRRFLDDTTTLGVVGEARNKVNLLLAMTSRRCEKPMNVVVKGESAAGKNHVAEGVASCFPVADVVRATNLSPQALSYWDGDLCHRILLICEVEGADRAEYTLRVLQSEGNLTVYYVTKVGGELKTIEKTVKGPAATITTTTRDSLHPENETRLVEIAIDESEEQTRRIIEFQKQQRMKGADPEQAAVIRDMWRGAQAALETVPVIIPFAELITFPTKQVRARRDFPKLMTLVEVSAFLHQFQRERMEVGGRSYIVADIRDYALAYDLVHGFLERVQSGLSDREVGVLSALEVAASEKLSARDVASRLGWYQDAGRKRAKRCLEGLQDKNFIGGTEPKPGTATLYWFKTAPSEAESGITTPEQLAAALLARGGHLPTTWTSPLSRGD